MSSFPRQLALLLWKNYTLRKRQIFRNIVEIFWPLAIFIILVAVRRRRPPQFPNDKRPFYFAPRALPSAGALPFIQSMFCNYRVNMSYEEPQDIPKFGNTLIYKMIRDLSPILTNQTRLQNLEQLPVDLRALYTDLTKFMNDTDNAGISVSDLFITHETGIELLETAGFSDETAIIMMESKVRLFGLLKMVRNVSWDAPSLKATTVKNATESDIKKLMDDQVVNINKLHDELCIKGGFEEIMELPAQADVEKVKGELCSRKAEDFIGIGFEIYSNREEILNHLKSHPELKDLMSWLNASTRDFNAVSREIGSLESLQKLYSDIRDSLASRNSSEPINLSSLNIVKMICGREKRPGEDRFNKKKTKAVNPPLTPQANGTHASNKTKKKIPSRGGGMDKTCNAIVPAKRVDCGWGGITESQCLRLSCCFDSSVKGAKYCFCPVNKANSSCCVRRRSLVKFFSLGSGYTGQIADLITRLLEGNILYTPDNNKTRHVVGKISAYLSSFSNGFLYLKKIRPLLLSFLSTAETIVKNKDQLVMVQSLGQIINSPKFIEVIEEQYPTIYPFVADKLTEIKRISGFLAKFNASYINEDQVKTLKKFVNLVLISMEELELTSRCYNLSNFFKPIVSEDELVKHAISEKAGAFLSSIVFLNLKEEGPFPKKIKYKLRYNPDYTPSTSKVKPKYWKPGPGPFGSNSFWHYQYINFGFVFMQDLVERSLLEVITQKVVYEPGVYIQQIPHPCYIQDKFIGMLGNFMPLFMTLAWIYTIAMITKSIVYEKELRLKEVMKVMGLSNSVHWTAWFITSLVTIAISVICLVALLHVGDILIHSDLTLVIVVLLIFACASIALAFLISVFFSRANISAACGGIIYFFTHLPYPVTLWFEDSLTFSHKAGVSLFSTTAFGLSFKYISRWEEQGIGAKWTNLFENPMPGDDFNLGWAIIFMIIDTLLYLTFTWYLEHVLPGQYGIPKPWYFPFTADYWSEKGRKIKNRNDHLQIPMQSNVIVNNDQDLYGSLGSEEMQTADDFTGKFEKEPPGLVIGVHIQNLVKVYKRGKKRAVDGLNLKMFEGQVTALLGHNGAGKSTTMSVLTGLYPPTSGTAVVYGNDIRVNIEGVRQSLGLCPQHNVLFDDLSVVDHMWFYGSLKGLRGNELKEEIERFLIAVDLSAKRDELSRNLSGGMKRKLSVAMAFIAGSKTVILDEPTSGVDPASRRGIWDLILKSKQGRTILLSTHYMDEADLLGDRISIISNGKLQCCGTPLFLKRRFGKGYLLTLTQDQNSNTNFQLADLTKLISSHIPSVELYEDFGSELKFILPSSARSSGGYTNLFEYLEENMQMHGIKDYGVSDTTLEEVFLAACDDDLDEELKIEDCDNVSLTGPAQSRRLVFGDDVSMTSFNSQTALVSDDETSLDFHKERKPEMHTGLRLWLQQFLALLVKRFHHARRRRKGFFSEILLPAIFVIVAMFVSLIRPPRTGEPSLELSTKMFSKPNYVISENSNINKISESLFNSFINNPGNGADCKKNKQCIQRKFNHENITFKHYGKTKCSCSTGNQQCPKDVSTQKLPALPGGNGDTFIDVTGNNITRYLVETTDFYKRHRYGGASFGKMLLNLPDLNVTSFSWSNLSSGIGVHRNSKVWFSMKGYHALPAYINMMNNAILRANLNDTLDPSEYGIIGYNHPMDYNQEQLADIAWKQAITDLFVAIFVILAMAFVPASFTVYLVQDRVSKSKHVQLVSGLHPVIYWIGNYTWDMINYLLPASSVVIIFLAFAQEAYVSAENFPVTVLLLLLYGWSMTPLMYPSSFFFDVPSTAYIVLVAGNIFVGIVATIATFILELFEDSDAELKMINTVLKQVLLIFPNYCLGRGMMDLAKNSLRADLYSRFGSGRKVTHPLDWNLAGRNVVAMIGGGFIYMTISLMIQYKFMFKPLKIRVNSDSRKDEEEDVANERNRITQSESNGKKFILKADNLTKVYKSHFNNKNTLAVDGLTFGVQPGECFGLLGVNGAGKTSTFKMLTGDTHVTSGDAFVLDQSIRKHVNNAHKYMGYCPQFDALDELLTGQELLMFYSQIRGMTKKEGIMMAEDAITTLGLTPYKDKICGDYSGGNKRKLSTAIALLGSPPLVLMDEPSTGMDPGARRFLWNVVAKVLQSGKSVVFTSHSMEECEALCTRLAIMVNGVLKCLGSPQHLRSKYGTGYTVILRAKSSCVDQVQDFMNSNFTDVELEDRHLYMLEYHISAHNLLLSKVFLKLETLRKSNYIEDYSVTQTTLDQIFVNFARNQVEAVQIASEEDGVNSDIRMEDCSPREVHA